MNFTTSQIIVIIGEMIMLGTGKNTFEIAQITIGITKIMAEIIKITATVTKNTTAATSKITVGTAENTSGMIVAIIVMLEILMIMNIMIMNTIVVHIIRNIVNGGDPDHLNPRYMIIFGMMATTKIANIVNWIQFLLLMNRNRCVTII